MVQKNSFFKNRYNFNKVNKEGNLPVENDKLTNSAREKDISVATSLSA